MNMGMKILEERMSISLIMGNRVLSSHSIADAAGAVIRYRRIRQEDKTLAAAGND